LGTPGGVFKEDVGGALAKDLGGGSFRRICEDSVRESLRVDLFGLADVNASRKEFTGAAGGGHVVFVLTLQLGFPFQMFVVLLLIFLF
jgi:hypothetical protein